MKPGDLVVLNKEGRRRIPGITEYGPWEVLKMRRYGVVAVRRVSRRTGRPWTCYLSERFLDVVVEEKEKRRT